jgi:sugar phosphate permease
MIARHFAKNRFYGWIVLAGALSMLISMVGNIVVSYSVFLPEMCDSMGWSRTALSGPFSLFWVTVGILGPLAGITTMRFGPRRNMIIGNAVLILGAAAMSRITEVWHIYLLYSIVIGAGQAFGSFIASNGLIMNWFHRRRTIAITLLSACGGIGGLIFPPVITFFMSKFGWRDAWLAVAGIHLIMGLLIPALLIRNTPKEMGQTPDGDSPTDTAAAAAAPKKQPVYQTKTDWEMKNVFKSRPFWMIVTFSAAIMFTVNFVSLHMVAYLKDAGYSAMTAATGIGVFNALNIAGQLGGGILASKIEARYIALVSTVGAVIGLVLLINVEMLPTLYIPPVVCGLCCGGVQVLTPIMLANYFGKTNYPKILGWVTPMITAFSSTSPLIAGMIYDGTGSYMPVFIISLSLLGAGLAGALFARPPSLDSMQ